MERVAYIDTPALTHNIATIAARTRARVMFVAKAHAYGHAGSVEDIVSLVAAAERGGASYVGVAHLTEAIALREAGVALPILAWLHTAESPFEEAVSHDIEIGISSSAELRRCAALSQPATVHLKVDTGLGRNGVRPEEWESFFQQVVQLQQQGKLHVKGLFSHFAVADEPERPETQVQIHAFREAIALAEAYNLDVELKHMANTPATLAFEDSHFNMVRVGLGSYGLKPFPCDIDLQPVMTLTTRMVQTKKVPAGTGVSYGLNYSTSEETYLGLVPVGYADGIPRTSHDGPVFYQGKVYAVVGNVAMDQIVVDLGPDYVDNGDDSVVIFGNPHVAGANAESRKNIPTAEDWAQAAGTINYEIVTRIGARVPRILIQKVIDNE